MEILRITLMTINASNLGYEPVYSGVWFSFQFTKDLTNFVYEQLNILGITTKPFSGENPNFVQYNQDRIMLTMWQNPRDITEVQSL